MNRYSYYFLSFYLLLIPFKTFSSDYVNPFIYQKNLERIYEIGYQFSHRYHWPIITAKNPDRFLGFRSGVNDGMHRYGIPDYFHGNVGFSRILNELNNFSKVVSNQDYRKTTGRRDSVITAAVGLVVLLERAGFHHIERSVALDKMRETIYLRNHFSLMAPEGTSTNPVRFVWSYLASRFFKFPLDLVSSGINELWLLRNARDSNKDEKKAIVNFIAGYATFGLEKDNRELMIWDRQKRVGELMPLRLINTVLENIENSENTENLELWALQEKYKIKTEYMMFDEATKIRSRLLNIYQQQDLSILQRTKIFLSEALRSYIVHSFSFLGLFLILVQPIKESFLTKESRLKSFFSSFWMILKGRNNRIYQQLGVVLLVFSLSLFFENVKTYEAPLETFKLRPR